MTAIVEKADDYWVVRLSGMLRKSDIVDLPGLHIAPADLESIMVHTERKTANV